MSPDDPLVSAEWLQEAIDAPDLRVVEATWFAPFAAPEISARDQYEAGHIPGAVFFDIDQVCDPEGRYPHTFPPPHVFASRVRKLGIGDGHRIVLYDRNGFFASARAWWMFRAMGHTDVKVLDGGYSAWQAANGDVSDQPTTPVTRHFTPQPRNDLVKTIDEVRQASVGSGPIILDARPPGRFKGTEAEPRPGLAAGHIPNSLNLPASQLLTANGEMKDTSALSAHFEAAGIDPAHPIIASCGSGVSAAIIVLALARLGNDLASVYDGSWTEWALTPGAPIATGD